MSTKTSNQKKNGVSIIGLGPMGQAMARAYLAAQINVTVWNRTTSKAEALAEEGATKADTPAEALKANKLTILSLTEYDIMYKVLNDATDVLQDRLLVNLSSDTPEKARKAEEWAHSHGAKFLAGGVMVDPPLVGKPEAYIFYSGDRKVFEANQVILKTLGKPDYLGNDPGLSQLYYQALLDIMFTSAAGVFHAVALIRSAGIQASSFEPYVNDQLDALSYFFKGMVKEVDKGEYDGALHSMNMMAAGMSHVAHASRDANIDTSLPNLLEKIFDQTVAEGYGNSGLASIFEVLKKPTE